MGSFLFSDSLLSFCPGIKLLHKMAYYFLLKADPSLEGGSASGRARGSPQGLEGSWGSGDPAGRSWGASLQGSRPGLRFPSLGLGPNWTAQDQCEGELVGAPHSPCQRQEGG